MNELKGDSADYIIKPPQQSEWVCDLFGTANTITLRPLKGREPHFFWRWMQFICFGNRWRKIPEGESGND